MQKRSSYSRNRNKETNSYSRNRNKQTKLSPPLPASPPHLSTSASSSINFFIQQIAGRTNKEWYKDNKEKVIKRIKENDDNNKDKSLEKMKEYANKNKDTIQEN